jgi:hypothetical protein
MQAGGNDRKPHDRAELNLKRSSVRMTQLSSALARAQRTNHSSRTNSMTKWPKRTLVWSLSCSLAIAGVPVGAKSATEQNAAPAPAAVGQQQPNAAQLDQLVGPIALYPDGLVAQVLAASSYPAEVVEAARWMRQHSSLQGQALAQGVNQQSWDPSVKALTQFPSVLQNMSKNLSWTAALGDAYVSQQQSVLDAVQTMRQRAQSAGNLKSTPQQTVATQGQTIVIEPANPDLVYVPQYDPWLVYGAPLVAYPYWAPFPGLYIGDPGVLFGLGFGVGLFAGFGWGWGHWGADWHHHRLTYDNGAYVSHGRGFAGRSGSFGGRAGVGPSGFHGGNTARMPTVMRGSGVHSGIHSGVSSGVHPGVYSGVHSGGFSGFGHGAVAGSYSYRAPSSFGGGFHGGGFRGGGGGFHGGGRR